MCLNHPHTWIRGKIIFHKIAPWCQNGWGPLLEEAAVLIPSTVK